MQRITQTLLIVFGAICLVSCSDNNDDEPEMDPLQLQLMSTGCGNEDGEISATATGGDGTYLFGLEGGDLGASGTFTGLMTGTYEVSVEDGVGTTQTSMVRVGVSLEDQIMPIINTSCARSGCHVDVSDRPVFDSKENVIAFADRIKTRTEAGTMPPTGGLPDTDVALITEWVECGANDN